MIGGFKSIRAVSFLWLGAVLGAGFGFLAQMLLARSLGAESFGLFSAGMGLITLITPMAGFGIAAFWLRVFGEEGWGAVRWLPASFRFVSVSAVVVVAGLLLWALYGPHDEQTRHVLMILSFVVLGQSLLELVGSRLQLEERYGLLALWQLIPSAARFLLVLVFVHVAGMSLVTASWIYAGTAIVMFLAGAKFLAAMCQGHFHLKGHEPSPPGFIGGILLPPTVRTVAAESWAFGMAGIFYIIYFQSNIVLLKYLDGDKSAGLYNAAFLILGAIYLFPSVVYTKYLLPKVHRWASHDSAKLREVYVKGNKLMVVFGLMAMAGVLVLSPIFIPFAFGREFIAAADLLRVLCLAIPIRFLASSVGAVLTTKRNMQAKVKAMGLVALFNVAMNFLMIPKYGVYGAAVVTVIGDMLLLMLYVLLVRRVSSELGWQKNV